MPEDEGEEDEELLEAVGGDEPVVHGVRVVLSDEVEAEEREGEDHHEAVDAGALVRGEELPPPESSVRQDHREVDRHHRRDDVVSCLHCDHVGNQEREGGGSCLREDLFSNAI